MRKIGLKLPVFKLIPEVHQINILAILLMDITHIILLIYFTEHLHESLRNQSIYSRDRNFKRFSYP